MNIELQSNTYPKINKPNDEQYGRGIYCVLRFINKQNLDLCEIELTKEQSKELIAELELFQSYY